jgi:hypothetical protein
MELADMAGGNRPPDRVESIDWEEITSLQGAGCGCPGLDKRRNLRFGN